MTSGSGSRRPGRNRSLFLLLGIVFLALGLTSNRTFLGVGAAFLVIGLAQIAGSRRRTKADPP